MKYAIVTGELNNGFQFWGPFDSFDEAFEYASDGDYDDFHIVEIKPKEDM